MLAISYITAHFLFASAKYLFTQNCKAPSGVEIFDGFSQSELKQDADLARRDLAKDAKIARRRAYAFDSLRLYHNLVSQKQDSAYISKSKRPIKRHNLLIDLFNPNEITAD